MLENLEQLENVAPLARANEKKSWGNRSFR